MRSSFAFRSSSAARASEAPLSAAASAFSRSLTRSDSFLVSNAQRVAVERQDGVVSAQALVRFAQPLELALRLEVGDFRSLDLDQRLINRTQGFVELRTDGLDIAK